MRALIKRLGELIAVLLIVSFGVFLLVSLLPGDPAVAIWGRAAPHRSTQTSAPSSAWRATSCSATASGWVML